MEVAESTEDAIIRRIEKNHERKIRINHDLEMRIKEWRYKHFKALNIPSYMVMSDKTLQEIANRISEEFLHIHVCTRSERKQF